MEATGSNPVEPTNMDKSPETDKQMRFPETKAPLPVGEYIDLIRGESKIKALLVKTDDPLDPYKAIDPTTRERIEMDIGEKSFVRDRFGIVDLRTPTQRFNSGPNRKRQK